MLSYELLYTHTHTHTNIAQVCCFSGLLICSTTNSVLHVLGGMKIAMIDTNEGFC